MVSLSLLSSIKDKVKLSLKFIPNASVLEHRARKCGLWLTHAFIPFLRPSVHPVAEEGERDREEEERGVRGQFLGLLSGRPSFCSSS